MLGSEDSFDNRHVEFNGLLQNAGVTALHFIKRFPRNENELRAGFAFVGLPGASSRRFLHNESSQLPGFDRFLDRAGVTDDLQVR